MNNFTVGSHGLSCEVCKAKVHKRCAPKAVANCKWTTLATVGREIIEDVDGVGNFPFSQSFFKKKKIKKMKINKKKSC